MGIIEWFLLFSYLIMLLGLVINIALNSLCKNPKTKEVKDVSDFIEMISVLPIFGVLWLCGFLLSLFRNHVDMIISLHKCDFRDILDGKKPEKQEQIEEQ